MNGQADNPLFARIQRLLDEAVKPPGTLRVVPSASHAEDEWLYAVVTHSATGMGVAQYSKTLSDIEKKLREQERVKVLLVPALNDLSAA